MTKLEKDLFRGGAPQLLLVPRDGSHHQPDTWEFKDSGSMVYHKDGIHIGHGGMAIQNIGINGYIENQEIRPEDVQLISKLGEGSSCSVYVGKHVKTNQYLAVKRVKPSSKARRTQLINDLRGLIGFRSNPHLVHLHAAFITDIGEVDLIMEYMSYGSLQRVLDLKGLADPEAQCQLAVAVLHGICRGLQVLHAQKVVHRDVKPENVLVGANGQLKLGDFGLAKNTNLSVCKTFVGTAVYMAPERLEGKPYDMASDIWSVACIAFELLEGRGAFQVNSMLDLFDAVVIQPSPEISQGSTDLQAVVNACFEKDPGARPLIGAMLENPGLQVLNPESVLLERIGEADLFMAHEPEPALPLPNKMVF